MTFKLIVSIKFDKQAKKYFATAITNESTGVTSLGMYEEEKENYTSSNSNQRIIFYPEITMNPYFHLRVKGLNFHSNFHL